MADQIDMRALAAEKTKGEMEYRSLTFDRAAVNVDDRRVDMAMSSEQPVERWFGNEILDHRAEAIDVSFMGSGMAPLLLDHKSDQQIGVVEDVSLGADKKFRGTVRFSKNVTASEVFDDVADGIRSNVSIGYRISEMVLESRDEKNGDTYRAVKWQPLEVSIVSVPADRTVGVGRAAAKAAEPKSKQENETMPDAKDMIVKDKTGNARSPNEISEEMRAQFAAQRDDAVKAALRDAADIEALGAKHNQQEMARKALKDGVDIATFRGQLLDVIGNKPLETAEIGMTDGERQEFSMIRMLNALANPQVRVAQEAAAFEFEACSAAAEKYGRSAKGTVIPVDVMASWGKRDLSAGVDTNIVFDDTRPGSFIELLRNASSVMQAGATMLTGLQGDVKIPTKATASSTGWVSTEGGAVAESEPTFGQVSMTPKLVGGFTDVTRQMLQQASLGMEGLIRADLGAAIGLAIDLGGLEGSGSSGQPTGIKNTTGINAPTSFAGVNPTRAEVIAMKTAVAEDNALMGNLAFILNATMAGALENTVVDSGSGRFVYEDNGQMVGRRALLSNQVTAGDLYFGNFSDLLLGFWGGLDILVDPYTASTTGTVRIVAMQTVDVAVRHAVSFAVNNDGV